MKEAINLIKDRAAGELQIAQLLRQKGDHINATHHEQLAKNLTKIAKLARVIYLK